MSTWPSTRARRVYQALVKIGWKPVHQTGSHVKLRHSKYSYPYTWAFDDGEELGPKILARIAKKTALRLLIYEVQMVQSYNAAHLHAQKFGPQPSPEC